MKRFVVCRVTDLAPGERRIVSIAGRSIGIFNVDGHFFAVRNRCPHKGGALCAGPLCGTALPVDGFKFVYGREGRILRCAWHGWEFDIETGQALVDPRLRAQTYPVTVEDEQIVVSI
jgi:nitrite reductase/ring-hydroxylating ferredoxin subunit